jgi:hypothetical protein
MELGLFTNTNRLVIKSVCLLATVDDVTGHELRLTTTIQTSDTFLRPPLVDRGRFLFLLYRL